MGSRRAALAGGLFAALALVAASRYIVDEPTVPHAVAVFERYEQRPACGITRVSHHALVALKPTLPSDAIGRVVQIEIVDPALPSPVRATVDGGSYAYGDLFGKPAHLEQWRYWCEAGTCLYSLNYYANEYAAGAAGERTLTVTARDADGLPLAPPQRIQVHAPTPEEAESHPYIPLDAGLNDGVLWAEVGPGAGGPVTVMFQTRDGRGEYGEREVEVSRRTRSRLEFAVGGPLTYAGVFAYRGDGAVASENKVELLDATSPAYACPGD